MTQHDVDPDPAAPLHRLPRPAPAGRRPRPAHQGGHAPRRQVRARRSFPASRTRACSSRRSAPAQMPPRERLVEVSVKPIEPAEIDVARPVDRGRCARGRRRAGRRHHDARPAGHRQGPRLLGLPAAAAGRGARPCATPRASATRSTPSSCRSSKRRGSRFAPEADRPTLLRRASFDLTGLPPEPAEVQAFLADTRAGRLRDG